MATKNGNEVLEAGRRLAKANIDAVPRLIEIWQFPDQKEVRLIEVDPHAFPHEGRVVEPFYFPPDPQGGVAFPTAIALIRPEEKKKLIPPKEWGSWKKGIRIWPQEKS